MGRQNHVVEVSCEEMNDSAGKDPTRSASTLLTGGSGTPAFRQAGDVPLAIVLHAPVDAEVDD